MQGLDKYLPDTPISSPHSTPLSSRNYRKSRWKALPTQKSRQPSLPSTRRTPRKCLMASRLSPWTWVSSRRPTRQFCYRITGRQWWRCCCPLPRSRQNTICGLSTRSRTTWRTTSRRIISRKIPTRSSWRRWPKPSLSSVPNWAWRSSSKTSKRQSLWCMRATVPSTCPITSVSSATKTWSSANWSRASVLAISRD